MISKVLDQYFPELARRPELKEELISVCSIHTFKSGTVILRQGEYIKVIPLVISGLVKVFKGEEVSGSEVLLYYIKPGESCVMSTTTLMKQGVSQVKAVIEKDAEIIVIPAAKVLAIAKKYPRWNEFIYDLFNLKFEELLNVIEILTFSNKEKRLFEYLKKESKLKKSKIIYTTHQQIAQELGSSREVISRLLKKLEHANALTIKKGSIELLKD